MMIAGPKLGDQSMAADDLKVTVLSENTTSRPGILAEHGLSLLIQSGDTRVLFDTGASELFKRNARKLRASLESLDAVFISHGHYDHTGGLRSLLEEDVAVYGHPDIFVERFSLKHGRMKSIGFPEGDDVIGTNDRFHLSRKPQSYGCFRTTGEVPRICDFEKPSSRFFLDRDRERQDTVLDDQSLYVATSRGLVVFLGCCHAGLINTLNHIRAISGERHIHWIIGGTHLLDASEERLKSTVGALGEIGFDRISPLHCTGLRGQHFFLTYFEERYHHISCGDAVSIQARIL
jgi:7,8-dihydropterin-6-yl-methyl-4-(beta-D-ribofuranosyl)aminobenzene 5'-phosphate synthase